jgi:hypothetical protein
MECPCLVWLTPTIDEKDVRSPKKRLASLVKKYSVAFICAHSEEPWHKGSEIEARKAWFEIFPSGTQIDGHLSRPSVPNPKSFDSRAIRNDDDFP